MMTGVPNAVCARGDHDARAGLRRAITMVLGMLLAVAALLGLSQPAAAAPTVTYPGAISNVALEKTSGSGPLTQWQAVRITGDWSVPVGAVGGDTFGMTLPAEFRRSASGAFDITDPTSGTLMAKCTVAEGQGPDVVCTLTAAVDGLEEVRGAFWLQATASRTTTSDTVRFDLGGTVQMVDLPGEGGIVPEAPTAPGAPYKYGGVTDVDGRLRWAVGVPGSSVAAGAFQVTDTLDQGRVPHRYTEEAYLLQRPVKDGRFVGTWTPVDKSRYSWTFSADGKSFTVSASGLPASGFSYELVYYTRVDGPFLAGDVFGNRAAVNTTQLTARYTATESGGGGGEGVAYTAFTITKKVSGERADAARSATYTVRYSVKGANAAPTTMTVPVGQPVRSERAPLGSTFVIEEIDLPTVPGVTWGQWTLTGDSVSETGDGTYEVTPGAAGVELTLTNVANAAPTTPSTTNPPTSPPVTSPPVTGPPASPPATPLRRTGATPPGELALTGGDNGLALLPLALVLIVGGGVSAVMATRRHSRSRQD